MKTLLLNAAQDTMAPPLTPPSPAGEISPPTARPQTPAYRGLFSFRTAEGGLPFSIPVLHPWAPVALPALSVRLPQEKDGIQVSVFVPIPWGN